MVDFNFTVRATDDIGAYTERDFSITVENTLVNQFMATTSLGHILTSVDGYNWVQQNNVFPAPSNNAFGQVINANGFWLVVTGTNTYIRSIDSITWTQHTFPAGYSFTLTGQQYLPMSKHFAYGDGKIAVLLFDIADSQKVYFYSTTDGITWTQGGQIPLPAGTNQWTSVSNVEYGNGIWLCSRRITSSYINAVSEMGYKSVDGGATWAAMPWPTGIVGANGTIRFTFVNGLWYGALYGNGYVLSNDATNWSYYAYPTTTPSLMILANITYANGKIFGFGECIYTMNSTQSGTDWTSTFQSVDGLSWNKASMTFAANSGSNLVNTYPQSYQYWSYRTSTTATDQAFNHVESLFHNGLYMLCTRNPAGANSNGILVSQDGVTWTRPTGFANTTNICGIAALRLDDTV